MKSLSAFADKGKRVGARKSKHMFRSSRWKRQDKRESDAAGIPSYLRQYAKRYGVEVDAIIRIDQRYGR